jgi:hypothetical protein
MISCEHGQPNAGDRCVSCLKRELLRVSTKYLAAAGLAYAWGDYPDEAALNADIERVIEEHQL